MGLHGGSDPGRLSPLGTSDVPSGDKVSGLNWDNALDYLGGEIGSAVYPSRARPEPGQTRHLTQRTVAALPQKIKNLARFACSSRGSLAPRALISLHPNDNRHVIRMVANGCYEVGYVTTREDPS